jgi:hypothetical protein
MESPHPADKTSTDARGRASIALPLATSAANIQGLPHEEITMSANHKTYTVDQIAIAARELREAAGVDAERYTGLEVVSLLSGEIEILRQRGFTDERITDLLSGFDIEIKPKQIERRSRTPANFMRRLLWGRLNRARTQPGQLQTE